DSRLIAQLVERKLLSVLCGSGLLESMASEVLDSGRFMRHVQLVRSRLARMRRDAQAALESAGLGFDSLPEGPVGGIFLWARVPAAVDVDALVRSARDRSILLANGALFSPERVGNGRLRFNAAYSTAPELVRFLSASVGAAA